MDVSPVVFDPEFKQSAQGNFTDIFEKSSARELRSCHAAKNPQVSVSRLSEGVQRGFTVLFAVAALAGKLAAVYIGQRGMYFREQAPQPHTVAFDFNVPQMTDVFEHGKVSALWLVVQLRVCEASNVLPQGFRHELECGDGVFEQYGR